MGNVYCIELRKSLTILGLALTKIEYKLGYISERHSSVCALTQVVCDLISELNDLKGVILITRYPLLEDKLENLITFS